MHQFRKAEVLAYLDAMHQFVKTVVFRIDQHDLI